MAIALELCEGATGQKLAVERVIGRVVASLEKAITDELRHFYCAGLSYELQ
jgi:hypothetical protein